MRRIIIELHDCTPAFTDSVYYILKELQKRKLYTVSYLIEPNRNKQFPLSKHPKFVKKFIDLEKKGGELILHGLYHIGPEFLTLNKAQAKEYLDNATKLFYDAFDYVPKGFIPPLWQMSSAVKELLPTYGFTYTERLFTLYTNKKKAQFNFPLSMEGMGHGFKEWWTSRLTKMIALIVGTWQLYTAKTVRLTFHPREVTNGNIHAQFKLLDKFLVKGFVSVLCRDL